MPKWLQNDAKQSQNDPTMMPKWSQNDAKIDAKIDQKNDPISEPAISCFLQRV